MGASGDGVAGKIGTERSSDALLSCLQRHDHCSKLTFIIRIRHIIHGASSRYRSQNIDNHRFESEVARAEAGDGDAWTD